MTSDHLLKALFKSGQNKKQWREYYPVSQIKRMWSFTPSELRRGLAKARSGGLVEKRGDMFRLTEQGVNEGARITRLHRLWEVYLSRYLELPHDHVHRDAEDMEHIITPEMELQLEELLGRPLLDPHSQEIPRMDKEQIE